jgi:hypothetical protein
MKSGFLDSSRVHQFCANRTNRSTLREARQSLHKFCIARFLHEL